MSASKLFSTYPLENLTLQNRIVMAPLTRSRAVENNAPNEMVATYYNQRADAGLIIAEGTSPSPNGLGYPRIPGAFSEAQIEGWKKVTSAVHQKGAKFFLQLMHTGRVSHELNLPEGAEVVAPTSKTVSGEMYTDEKGMLPHTAPRLMEAADIEQAIQEYVTASKNAIEAGFDGVEIHGANGYLIEQFLNANVNELTNEYGGSAENRNRFALEVAKRVSEAIGAEKTGIRLSPYGVFNDTGAFDGIDAQYVALAEGLGKLNLAYLHFVDLESMVGSGGAPVELRDAIRKAFGRTVILSGGYDKAKAEADIDAGAGDLIAFGRPFISNPDLVDRLQKDAPLADPDPNTFYAPGEKNGFAQGYTDYPTLEEATA